MYLSTYVATYYIVSHIAMLYTYCYLHVYYCIIMQFLPRTDVTSDCPLDVCIKCFVYCHSTNKDVQELARKASEAPGGNKKGKCCICHSPLAVGPVCQDSEEEGEAKWPSLLDTFPVGPAEASLAESELGRKLLQQWPSTSQQVQVRWRPLLVQYTSRVCCETSTV